MHIGFYPDHSLARFGGHRPRARSSAIASVMKRILSAGRTLVHGQPVETLSDHLLDDIGLTRADVAALRR